MSRIRFITTNGKPQFAVVPIDLWNHFQHLAALIERVDPAPAVSNAIRVGAFSAPLIPAPSVLPEPATPEEQNIEDARAAVLANAVDELPANVRDDLLAKRIHPLKAWRSHRRMSATELATAANVSPSFVTLIETGRRRGGRKVLDRIGAALNAPVSALCAPPLRI